MNPWLHPVIVYRIFLLKQKMQLVIVNSRSLMNFSVGILLTLAKLVESRNFGIDNL